MSQFITSSVKQRPIGITTIAALVSETDCTPRAGPDQCVGALSTRVIAFDNVRCRTERRSDCADNGCISADVPRRDSIFAAPTKGKNMLYTIAVVLVILWLLGLVTSFTVGGFIHVLLVIAIVVVLLRVISGRGI
jgi:hypothetical protein